jgi:Leucine-rich repeat (LRR) protein
LEGELDLSDFINLEELSCSNNYLTQIIYPANPEKITKLDIENNNINSSDLTTFSKFRNLKGLNIGNTNEIKIQQGIYNRFRGSLEPLKELDKLEKLFIDNTDLDSGFKYLPDSLGGGGIFEGIRYDTELRPNCKLVSAKEELEKEI